MSIATFAIPTGLRSKSGWKSCGNGACRRTKKKPQRGKAFSRPFYSGGFVRSLCAFQIGRTILRVLFSATVRLMSLSLGSICFGVFVTLAFAYIGTRKWELGRRTVPSAKRYGTPVPESSSPSGLFHQHPQTANVRWLASPMVVPELGGDPDS